MNSDFWGGVFAGLMISMIVIMLIMAFTSPSAADEARMSCGQFEDIYGHHFDVVGGECLFQNDELSVPVEWDEVNSHKTIRYILGIE